MRAIRSSNTKPELLVRRLVHSLGYRFRLHQKDLPGKPDLVFSGRKAIIFVHGCFWHMHGCSNARIPKSNIDYWQSKLIRNCMRDAEHVEALIQRGWRVLTIWDCETTELSVLEQRIKQFLN
jgi:DNA mismatch endonuclease (patch repair protein)